MKKNWEKIKNHWHIDHEKITVRPSSDWAIIVWSFFGLLLLVGVLHAYLYAGWLRGDIDSEVESKLPTIDTAKLKVVIDSYQQRQKDFDLAGQTVAGLIDPSL